ncbi:hypothetical protein DAEQUDRAFT_248423 [Daedalea quercina L-15889]|uniref:Uncharacterized protein n=1 Tax=Daedalea quercina L-15889 TaxID=1314783 RepID=A0A165QME9_9APHY|nr:hypothetical protein DAEQUDRAFT_248423 [Daedalea quercina L-15889]
MKFVAVLPLLATSALASSALIPSGISSTCSSYLESFDQDTSLESCLSPVIQATSQFGASGNSTTDPTSSAVSSALSSLCSATACSSQTVRSKLSSLYTACTAELTSNLNKNVLLTYDVLYSIIPLQQAVCSKNSNGDYCVLSIAGSNSSSSSGTNDAVSAATSESFSSIADYLYSDASSSSVSRRDSSQTTVSIVPNTTTFAQNNLLFLFFSSNLSSSELCTTCARNVMTAYTNFESSVPYAPGISSSTLMSGQTALYKGIISTCGSSFMNSAAQAAGAISGGETASNSAPSSVAVGTKTVSAVLGAAVVAFLAML